ncbi:RICIN domain-containing protein (plasmid) [Ralstonia sp. R-29]|uniref:RICIN domain-containing protein n=1 Tax=Ralstonia sp. R-29 TaxID=3404059 RepID=UPI003CE8B288
MATQTKLIQWQLDTSFAMGVTDQIVGAPVVLSKINGGRNILWDVDIAKNVVLLSSSGDTLAMDFKNQQAANQVPIVLSAYNGAPTPTQQLAFWYLGRLGYITSIANPNLVLDVQNRVAKDGQTIWGYTFNGSPAQQWKAVDPFAFLAEAEPEPAAEAV